MSSIFKEGAFDNKVVLVTGSNSGIGESTVLLYSKLGAKVVVTGRDAERVGQVARKCEEASPKKLKPLQVVADMQSEDDINRLVDKVVGHFGQVDVLVNNAGCGLDSDCESPDALKLFDTHIQVNLRSVFQLCYRLREHLAKTKGCIINTSSICALSPYTHTISYCVAKAGVDMLTRCLAVKWGPLGIRVNSVNPAQVDTPIFSRAVALNPAKLESMWQAVADAYPVRRKGEPEDVANAIVFLSSPEAAGWITSVNLKIDGGFVDSPQLPWGEMSKERM